MDVNVLVLGDGIGGIVTANLLLKKAKQRNLSLKLKLVGKSPVHTYQPGMLFLPFQKPGYRDLSDIQKKTVRFIACPGQIPAAGHWTYDSPEGNPPESLGQTGIQAHLLEHTATGETDSDGGFSDEYRGEKSELSQRHLTPTYSAISELAAGRVSGFWKD